MLYAFLDIEADNLDADFGIVLSWAVYYYDDKTKAGWLRGASLKEADERKILDFLKFDIELFRPDYLITYYGSRFDIPFLRTRFLKHRIKWFSCNLKHKDLYYTVRYRFKFSHNTLSNVSKYYHLGSKDEVSGEIWQKARHGDFEQLEKIFKHNQKDVILLYRLWKRLREYVDMGKATLI